MTRPAFIIRPVEPGDLAQWGDLRVALWPDEPPDEVRAEAAPFFVDGRLADQPHGVFVACDADRPARLLGFIEVSLSGVDTPSDHGAAHVEAWYTVPSARRRGLGAALMRAGEDWARSIGREALTSDTTPAEYPHSTAAHRAAGFIVERVTIGEKKERWFRRQLCATRRIGSVVHGV